MLLPLTTLSHLHHCTIILTVTFSIFLYSLIFWNNIYEMINWKVFLKIGILKIRLGCFTAVTQMFGACGPTTLRSKFFLSLFQLYWQVALSEYWQMTYLNLIKISGLKLLNLRCQNELFHGLLYNVMIFCLSKAKIRRVNFWSYNMMYLRYKKFCSDYNVILTWFQQNFSILYFRILRF